MKNSIIFFFSTALVILKMSCTLKKTKKEDIFYKVTSYNSNQIKFNDSSNEFVVVQNGDTIRNVNDSGSTEYFKFDKLSNSRYLIKVLYVGNEGSNIGGEIKIDEGNFFIVSPIVFKKTSNTHSLNCCLGNNLVIFDVITTIQNPIFKNSFSHFRK
ncbi:MAG: hypothetical protein MUF58_19370 [Arcicella sp.]|jgi:hypothetical protein|nr:hypothetical protein [Arcicella sp.]